MNWEEKVDIGKLGAVVNERRNIIVKSHAAKGRDSFVVHCRPGGLTGNAI